ncbi:hypothetical protein LOZ53_006261 [Ophidiomyces ophidiicola]|nr:hypothetical protein LOZ54_005947 [Ophidiomyces ophidiicola]KAI1981587.1 hypothetical protein LOZ55_000609 [Ophidiomyces ophidiicola]KAI1982587.1 hypothetical protein LOZ53_006261 [Ophidiomyces ophidiicola]KAI1998699.1 hypothetical protein LOZ51_002433 [Ophidiomyces ophidiicola]
MTSIFLVDNTLPEPESDSVEPLSPSTSKQSKSLAKRITRSSVRKNLARRKYAKWQQERYDTRDGASSRENSLSRNTTLREPIVQIKRTQQTIDSTDGEVTDAESLLPGHGSQSEIDVLYENQRGWFFFGMPHYSEKSLLNLDPSAWLTKNLEVSPVDISNAQPPDPSWKWAWQTWYIDMSYDVDEEGWQYSFSFASKFAWHGTHPWYHSFVRRRRWIRKRVKTGLASRQMVLTEDRAHAYSALDEFITARTGTGTAEPSTIAEDRASYASWSQLDPDEEISPDEITNTVVLMKAVRKASLDREKIEAVKSFVLLGEEELVLLEDRIPDIMSALVFHTSKRQLAEFLVSKIEEIPKNTDDESARSKREYLIKAVDAIHRQDKDFEFWEDTGPAVGSDKGKSAF